MVKRDQRGFSLAEVVVALGVLASVLISVAGLLVVGTRLVNTGRGSSEALAVARDLMEEMQGWGFRQTFTELGCEVNLESCSVSTGDAVLAPWNAMLDDALSNGSLTVDVQSLEPGVVLENTLALRVIVRVDWKQQQRSRTLSLGMVRM